MTNEEILRHVDHTLLKAVSSWEEIKKLCNEALLHKTASVCIPPSYVQRIKRAYGDEINICTVIGFPLGYSLTEIKAAEVLHAISDGANEIDMVINIGDVKNGEFDRVEKEISLLKNNAGNKILKVIVETCYLTQEEKISLCKTVTNAGADYIKTSTGFGSAGAVLEDILLFKENIGKDVKIKAAGGIKTREDLVTFIEAGCERIGTSSALAILSGEGNKGY